MPMIDSRTLGDSARSSASATGLSRGARNEEASTITLSPASNSRSAKTPKPLPDPVTVRVRVRVRVRARIRVRVGLRVRVGVRVGVRVTWPGVSYHVSYTRLAAPAAPLLVAQAPVARPAFGTAVAAVAVAGATRGCSCRRGGVAVCAEGHAARELRARAGGSGRGHKPIKHHRDARPRPEEEEDASEEYVAPEASAATIRAGAVAARKRKVGSGAEVPAAKSVAWLGALSTSPSARPEAAGTVVAVAAVAAAAAAAAEGKRRVAFSAPVPLSKRGWAASGSRAIVGGLCLLAQL
jgi:hypothetical protein